MGNTNMSKRNQTLNEALAGISAQFRNRIIKYYTDLKIRYRQELFDASGLSAAKLSECVLRLLQHELTGSFTPFSKEITNFRDECVALERIPKTQGRESTRVIIPRALLFIYTLRSKRGIGHIGGDVEADRIDLGTITKCCDWIVCELLRIYHSLSLEEAQDLLDSISDRELPVIWEVGSKKRVLKEGLSAREQTLLLCYSCSESQVPTEDLCSWIEYSNTTVFKNRVLAPLHKARLIEYERDAELVTLSPKGLKYVEENISKLYS